MAPTPDTAAATANSAPSLVTQIGDYLSSMATTESIPVPLVAAYMLVGGLLALYLQFLYRHCNSSSSTSDAVTRIFPLLTMATIGVVSLVSFSPLLSLGLVGALSIVRFRSVIKEPEELVYLFLCIGVGVALGAGQPLLSVAMVIVATIFVLGVHYTGGKNRAQSLLLTITGKSQEQFHDGESGVMTVVNELVARYTLQRLDLEQDRGRMRIAINRLGRSETVSLIAKLRERLPDCEFTYINLEATS